MNLVLYFWLLLKASLFSTGGAGNLPSLHADLLARRWATDRQFAESLAIGQVSPGPNGLWVVSMAYLTAGIPGSILAVIAITIPPLIVLLAEKVYQRVQKHPGVDGFMRGLSLAIIAIFAVVLWKILGTVGIRVASLSIAFASFILMQTKRVSPFAIIVLSGAVGALLLR